MSLFDGIPGSISNKRNRDNKHRVKSTTNIRVKAGKAEEESNSKRSLTERQHITEDLTQENNLRLSNLVTSYGINTRSYNRSAEKRELNRQRNATTENYLKGDLVFIDVSESFLLCRCSEHEYPHEPHRNELATFELQHYGRKR